TETRNAEQARHKYNQRKEALLAETEPKLAKAGAPGERLKTLLAFKERVNKEGVQIAVPFGAGKPYLKDFEKRIKDLDAVAKMEERTSKSKAAQAKEKLEKEPEAVKEEKVAAMFGEKAALQKEGGMSKASGPSAGKGALAGGGLTDSAARRAESAYGSAKEPPIDYKIGRIKVSDLRKRGYTDENILDLEKGMAAASNANEQLHAKYPSAVADAYGSGTMTNIEDSAKWAFSGGGYKLNRGCISHQQTTL